MIVVCDFKMIFVSELDEKYQNCDQEWRKVKDELKTAETELENLKNQVPLSDILEKIETISIEIDGMKLKLKNLSENSVPLSPNKLKRVKDNNIRIVKEFK